MAGWRREPARHSLSARGARSTPSKSAGGSKRKFDASLKKLREQSEDWSAGLSPHARMAIAAFNERDSDWLFNQLDSDLLRKLGSVVERGWFSRNATYQLSRSRMPDTGEEVWVVSTIYTDPSGVVFDVKGIQVNKNRRSSMEYIEHSKMLGAFLDATMEKVMVADLAGDELSDEDVREATKMRAELNMAIGVVPAFAQTMLAGIDEGIARLQERSLL